MNKMISIGYGNVINADKIVAAVSPDSAPVKRLVQQAKDNGSAVDATQGRRTKGVIITDTNWVILTAILPETIASRCRGDRKQEDAL